jgi:2',3'-cyclic-nucleotide 2'-phosphodiesterase (5'-nucleotidase family)
MLFLEPRLRGSDAMQERWKAEALSEGLKRVGLAAWAPGFNDWADGSSRLAAYRDLSSAALLAGNIRDPRLDTTSIALREVGGIKVGLVGVSDPKGVSGAYPDGTKVQPVLDAMRAGIVKAKNEGARILIGLAALPRGEALRLADNVPDLHVLVIGKPLESGEANDAARAPVLAGSTLVVEAANHGQTLGVIDLFIGKSRDDRPLRFSDAGGLARAEELLSLAARIRDLEARVASWENDPTVKPEDLAARRA